MQPQTEEDLVLLRALKDHERPDGTFLLGGGDPHFILEYLTTIERGGPGVATTYRFNDRARRLLRLPGDLS